MLEWLLAPHSSCGTPVALKIIIFATAQGATNEVLQLVLGLVLGVDQNFVASTITAFILVGQSLRGQVA